MKILFVIFAFLISVNIFAEDFDINKKPEPLAQKEFEFPKYTKKVLSNGIKVFVIEDHEQPIVNFRFLIEGGSSMDGSKSGIAELTSQILSKGTKKKNAFQIASSLDGIGASFGLSAEADFISGFGGGLKKHTDVIMEVIADVLLNPSFPKEEFEKLVNQKIANIQYEKSEATTLANALSRKVVYGNKHPYAQQATESSVSSINIDDLKNYYSKYFIPNNTSIAVIGDISANDAVKILEKYLGNWKKAEKPLVNIPEPIQMPKGVYFVNRPGSVQSAMIITSLAVPYSSRDYEMLDLSASVIGAGFAGRLFKTLRETYSFTYTPFGQLTQTKYINRVVSGANVATAKTDSSIMITLEQLRLLANEAPTDDELNRIKSYNIGSYNMAFENSSFVASLIQNADFLGTSIDLVKAYTKRLQNISPYDVKIVASKYMNPDNSYIVIAGDPSIKPELEKYGAIFDYDLDLNPLSGSNAKIEKISMTADELLKKYTKAIGGNDELNLINTLVAEGNGKFEFQGESSDCTYKRINKKGNKLFQNIDINGYPQKLWVNGEAAYSNALGKANQQPASEFKKYLLESEMFLETKLISLGFKCEVVGKINGQILLKSISPEDEESTLYFDEESYLLTKKETMLKSSTSTEMGIESYSDYTKFGELTLPKTLAISGTGYKFRFIVNYIFNQEIDDKTFIPAENEK